MEYISKDSVKALSFRYLLKNGKESPPVVMLKSILRMPASDVARIVRGKNMTEENPVDQFVCSECGVILEGYHRREIDDDDGFEIYYEFKPNFCPNCGADMREEN